MEKSFFYRQFEMQGFVKFYILSNQSDNLSNLWYGCVVYGSRLSKQIVISYQSDHLLSDKLRFKTMQNFIFCQSENLYNLSYELAILTIVPGLVNMWLWKKYFKILWTKCCQRIKCKQFYNFYVVKLQHTLCGKCFLCLSTRSFCHNKLRKQTRDEDKCKQPNQLSFCKFFFFFSNYYLFLQAKNGTFIIFNLKLWRSGHM